MPIETNKNSVRWLIKRLQETKKVTDNYKDNLSKIFRELFVIKDVLIDTDAEDVVVVLYLSELTQTDIEKLNEMAEIYTINALDDNEFALQIFTFKDVDD